MKTTSLLTYPDYRDYLISEFQGSGPTRGRRLNWAKALRCQTSFVSQVLTHRAHLSLEHAIQTAEFLDLTTLESQYFMELVHYGRAGSNELKKFYAANLKQIKNKLSQIKERIQVKSELTLEDQSIYYGTWYYSAIHILCAFSEFNTSEELSARLKLSPKTVKSALQFLESRGFIEFIQGKYSIGKTRILLDRSSPLLNKHHSNWRLQAIQHLQNQKAKNLHYSAVLGISKKDFALFKEKLLKILEEFEPIIRDSEIEVPVGFLIDCFEIEP